MGYGIHYKASPAGYSPYKFSVFIHAGHTAIFRGSSWVRSRLESERGHCRLGSVRWGSRLESETRRRGSRLESETRRRGSRLARGREHFDQAGGRWHEECVLVVAAEDCHITVPEVTEVIVTPHSHRLVLKPIMEIIQHLLHCHETGSLCHSADIYGNIMCVYTYGGMLYYYSKSCCEKQFVFHAIAEIFVVISHFTDLTLQRHFAEESPMQVHRRPLCKRKLRKWLLPQTTFAKYFDVQLSALAAGTFSVTQLCVYGRERNYFVCRKFESMAVNRLEWR